MKNFKKILATVLAVLFVASVMVVSVSAASAKWYQAAINYLDGLTISDIGTAGEEEVSRDEFVTWVAKIESHQLIEKAWQKQEWTALSTFDDVSDSEHLGAIGYSVGRGFIKGNGDGTFAPHATVTLGEAAAVIVRLMDYEDRVKGETWDEEKPNYMYAANTFCGAFDDTFLAKTGIYDPDHKLTKGEAAYLLYTIMNGADWSDNDQINDWDNLRLTSYGVDLGEYFAAANNKIVKAQFVVANLPLVYDAASTLRTFARHDAYVTGGLYDSLFADSLYMSNGILDTSAGKVVKLQNIATNGYITLTAADFAAFVKKAAGHSASDDKTDALNYISLGNVVTISTAKANRADLVGTADGSAFAKAKVSAFTINAANDVDAYIGTAATTLANIKTGKQALGWKSLDAEATATNTYARLTSTPVTWTDVKYTAGVPTSGKLVLDGETYSVVTSYTGKANEIKVYAPKDILNTTSKAIVSVVGRVGDKVYKNGIFSMYEYQILNLHKHEKVETTYYTKKVDEDTGKETYEVVDFEKTPFDPEKTYYVATDAEYRPTTDADFQRVVNGYKVTEVAADAKYTAGTKYYLKDGDNYNPITLADVDREFKEGVTYYVYDQTNDKYIDNGETAFNAATTYYLQKAATQETVKAAIDDFKCTFKAGTKYYTAEKNPTFKLGDTYYAEDANTKVLSPNADAVTKKWVLATTYYTLAAAVYTPVDKVETPAPDGATQYYVKTSGSDLIYEEVPEETRFDYSKNYYTAVEADTAGDVNLEKTYYKKVGTTTNIEPTKWTADFTVGFKGGTKYYTYDKTTDTYPLNNAAYDSEKTYYVEKAGANAGNDELRLATLADFAVTWKDGVTYYEVTKVNTSTTDYDGTPAHYYVEETDEAKAGQLRVAVAADFLTYLALGFEADVTYYEETANGRFIPTTDAKYNVQKTYYVDGSYNKYFTMGDTYYTLEGAEYKKVDAAKFTEFDPDEHYYVKVGNDYVEVETEDLLYKVKETFALTEIIPSWVSYELTVEGGAFVTNTTFNLASEFVVDGRLDKLTINTAKALSVKEALQLILGPAQGECNVVFSDTDGDGAYDVAVVTESSRALYYNEINSSTDPANEGYLGGNAGWTREVYDSFGNYIMAVQGLKGHNIGGLVVDKTVAFGGSTGNGTDGWNITSTVATNKVQLVVCSSDERQYTDWTEVDTSQYGARNAFPYVTADVADLITGYIETVEAGTTKVGGVEVYTATVIKADGERTTVYIPVDPAEKITLSVTVDGVASDVTFAAGRSLLSFVTDHVENKEIGTVQTGSWMAGHTVKYVAYENGVAWCMVDTAETGYVKGYVASVAKSDTGDNTYTVKVVASEANGSASKKFAATTQSVANVIEYSVTSIKVVNSFGIDALFAKAGEMTVKAYKMTQKAVDKIKFAANGNGTIGGAYGTTDDFVILKTIQKNQNMTALWYDTNGDGEADDPNGTTKPYIVADNWVEIETTTPTYTGSFLKAGAIISAYDYELYVKDEYKTEEYFEEKNYDAHALFGYIDWTKLGELTESSTTKYIGAKVKTLEVKGSATAVWTYDEATYALVNATLVKGLLYNSGVKTDEVVSQKDLVYLSFTKDAGAYYTIDGLDKASYKEDVATGETDWGAITFTTNNFVVNKHTGYRAGAYFGYRFALLETGAGADSQWTNVGDFDNYYILGYSKKADSKVDTKDANDNVNGYKEEYKMIVGQNPYYKRTIKDGKITYTLYFTTVKTLEKVYGTFYYQVDANNTLLVELINKATMKQEVDDGVSYTDNKFYVDPATKLVYLIYGDAKYDKTKTTTTTPIYDTTAKVEVGEAATNVKASDIKEAYKLDKDVKEENLVSLSVAPYVEGEAGYVPGLYHVYLTSGLGTVKSFQMTQNSTISVIYPDSTTGNFSITLTNAKDIYASKATVFVTDYQYKGDDKTCTMLSVIGKLNKPVATPVTPSDPTSDNTVSSGVKLTYLNADATVIAEAIEVGNYWVIRSTASAIDVTTGEEVGAIQFVFTTYKESTITKIQEALRAGGYFLINKDNEVISAVDETEADTYGTEKQYAQVLTGTITGVTADGKTTATIKGKENTDISKKTFVFIYHDMEGKNFGIGGSSTNVTVATTEDILATFKTDEDIIAEGVNNATHYYLKEDVEEAVESLAKAKEGAITSYLNGTFWNVEFSPLYNYFVSQTVSYQNRTDVKLSFNYVVINDVYYVFVNSFAK